MDFTSAPPTLKGSSPAAVGTWVNQFLAWLAAQDVVTQEPVIPEQDTVWETWDIAFGDYAATAAASATLDLVPEGPAIILAYYLRDLTAWATSTPDDIYMGLGYGGDPWYLGNILASDAPALADRVYSLNPFFLEATTGAPLQLIVESDSQNLNTLVSGTARVGVLYRVLW